MKPVFGGFETRLKSIKLGLRFSYSPPMQGDFDNIIIPSQDGREMPIQVIRKAYTQAHIKTLAQIKFQAKA